jgi:hypothetical protein
VRGGAVRLRRLGVEQRAGQPMGGGEPRRGQLGLDRGAQQRVRETQRSPGAQESRQRQLVGRALPGRERQPGQRDRVAQLSVAVEHRDRARELHGGGGQPPEPARDVGDHPLGPQGQHALLRRRGALGGKLAKQLAE